MLLLDYCRSLRIIVHHNHVLLRVVAADNGNPGIVAREAQSRNAAVEILAEVLAVLSRTGGVRATRQEASLIARGGVTQSVPVLLWLGPG